MGFQNPFIGNINNNNNNSSNNNSSQNFGPLLALWGTVVSTLGDTMQAIGGAIAIEESNIADQQQQQELQNLQSQIDELKKAQTSPDIDKFNKLLEQVLNRLEPQANPKKSTNHK
ncbi:hypothetical protein MHB48_07205 [Psychrobacillus sp. FSL H8-0483]|uniref:hypothetical protein n=1 Tax=Psychrobacillus sp. FSL H8-0483 TaxID=2921389 RepID=UPI00315AAC1E